MFDSKKIDEQLNLIKFEVLFFEDVKKYLSRGFLDKFPSLVTNE